MQRVDRDPMDCRNIKGVVLNIAKNGYKIGGKNCDHDWFNESKSNGKDSETILDIPENTDVNVMKQVQLLSLSGDQGHVYCSCRGGCKTGKCKISKD